MAARHGLEVRVNTGDHGIAQDWQTWEKLSKDEGAFVYLPQPLMGHRVHAGSTTTEVIGDGSGRTAEDLEMFRVFWPEPIARLLVKVYSSSQASNQT